MSAGRSNAASSEMITMTTNRSIMVKRFPGRPFVPTIVSPLSVLSAPPGIIGNLDREYTTSPGPPLEQTPYHPARQKGPSRTFQRPLGPFWACSPQRARPLGDACYPPVTTLRRRHDRVPVVDPIVDPVRGRGPEVEVSFVVNRQAGSPTRPVVAVEQDLVAGRHRVPQIARRRQHFVNEGQVRKPRARRLLESLHEARAADPIAGRKLVVLVVVVPRFLRERVHEPLRLGLAPHHALLRRGRRQQDRGRRGRG